MVFPQFHPGVGIFAPPAVEAQRRAVRAGGQHRARREVGADADDLRRLHFRRAQDLGNDFRKHLQVVGGVLQRRVRRQTPPITRQVFFDHALRIIRHRRADFTAGGHVHQQRPGGQGAEVDAKHVTVVASARRTGGFHGREFCKKPGPGKRKNYLAHRCNPLERV